MFTATNTVANSIAANAVVMACAMGVVGCAANVAGMAMNAINARRAG